MKTIFLSSHHYAFCFLMLAAGFAGPMGAHADTALTAIPLSKIGAKTTAEDKGRSIGIRVTEDGAQLRSGYQKLSGTVTQEGLRLVSTEEAGGSLQLKAAAVGRVDGGTQKLPASGRVSSTDSSVTFARPGLVEEYSVSAEGVRQDFIIGRRPAGAGDLSVELALGGARAAATAYGAKLTLDGSGRELAYHRLHVTDARGEVLKASLGVTGPARLEVRVEDASAVYPLRIDPTFSDADWVALGSGTAGVAGTVQAIAVDGSEVYVGGTFTVAGGVAVNKIARWNGYEWTALGAGVTGGDVLAISVRFGQVFVGGSFTSAGGVANTGRIAKWDGSNWSALGTGITTGNVNGIFVRSPSEVYIGGTFTAVGGVANTSRISKWNGSAWTALGTGMNNSVFAIAGNEFGSEVYAGGTFTTANGVSAVGIAKWDGSAFTALGTGASGGVNSIAVENTDVYIGGAFTAAGGVTGTSRIAKWNGTAWSALGSGMNSGTVSALAVDGPYVYAGGNFSGAVGVGGTARLAQWNGTAWTSVSANIVAPGAVIASVNALGNEWGEIYVGGVFTGGGVTNVAKIMPGGGSLTALGSGNGGVHSITSSGGNVYATGGFTQIGGVSANYLAKWNGVSWSAMGSGLNGVGTCVHASGTDVYVAGYFTSVDGVAANGIAKWNGTAWSALGTGISSGATINAMVVDASNNLYIAGNGLSSAGGVSVASIARWNGTTWSALGTGLNSTPFALAVYGTDIIVGGAFGTAGGVTANRLARWNGSAWSAFGGTGTSGTVYALEVNGTDLYAAGLFSSINSVTAANVAKWNGTAWSALFSGLNGQVNALRWQNSRLYAAGNFTQSGATPTSRVAMLDTASWTALGSGVDNGVVAMTSTSAQHLFLAGNFGRAGGALISPQIVRARLEGALDENSALSGLVPGSGALSATFATGTTGYAMFVANNDTTVAFTPTKQTASGTIEARINGGSYSAVSSGSSTGALALNPGLNTVDFRVTAENGLNQTIYSVGVVRAATGSSVVMDDAFDNNALGTNPNGIGTGFNDYGQVPSPESGGVVTMVDTTSTLRTLVIASKDTFAPFGTLPTTATFRFGSVGFDSGWQRLWVGYRAAGSTQDHLFPHQTPVQGLYLSVLSHQGEDLVRGNLYAVDANQVKTLLASWSWNDNSQLSNLVVGLRTTSATYELSFSGATATPTFTFGGAAGYISGLGAITSPFVTGVHNQMGNPVASAQVDRITVAVDTLGSPEIAVSGNGSDITDGDSTPASTDHTDFGTVLSGGSALTRTFTISNTGTLPLNLSGLPRVAVSGANAGDFSVTTLPAATVAAGGSTTFVVTFTPGDAGLRTAALSLANDDSDENPFNFTIQAFVNNPPVLTLPASPVIAEAASASGAVVSFSVSATDAQDGALTPTATPASGSPFPLGNTTVNVSATDSHGAVTTGSFIVSVRDTTPPVLTPNTGNSTVVSSNIAGVEIGLPAATATDAVTASPVITYSHPSGSLFPIGNTTVTITATDAAGNSSTFSYTLTVELLSGPGTLDQTTPLPAIGGGFVSAMAEQIDGKMLIGGQFTSVGGVARSNLARLNADGTLDTSFTAKVNDGEVLGITADFDGRFYVYGQFTTVQGMGTSVTTPRRNIARFNANGTVDTSFDPSPDGRVQTLLVIPGVKVLLGGDFLNVKPNGTATPVMRRYFASLNYNGTLDTTIDLRLNGPVSAMALAADWKILVGGNFSSLNPTGTAPVTRRNLLRLNFNGTLDTAFDPAPDGAVTAVCITQDEKVLIGGHFLGLQPNGGTMTSSGRLARLNVNGTLDTGFEQNCDGPVLSLAPQCDGKVILAGSFAYVGGFERSRVARVNANGTLDHDFDPHANATVRGATLQSNGKIILAGDFSLLEPKRLAGAPASARIARLQNYAASESITVSPAGLITVTRTGSAPEVQSPSIGYSSDGVNFPIAGTPGRIAGTSNWQLNYFGQLPTAGTVRFSARSAGAGQSSSRSFHVLSQAYTGLAVPDIALEQPAGTNLASGSAVNYGSISLGGQVDRVFTLKNSGTFNLTFPNTPIVQISGPDAAMFTVSTQPTAGAIAPAGSKTFTVRFRGTTLGARTATLTIWNNDFDERQFTLALSATVGPGLPTVGSPTHTQIANNAATLGGNVTADGGQAILERGVVFAPFSVNSSPAITDANATKIAATTNSTGIFTLRPTGLTPVTYYAYRAYATNASGTAYSGVGSFTTLPGLPTLALPTATSITGTTALLNSSIVNSNGSTPTSRGFVLALASPTSDPVLGGPGVISATTPTVAAGAYSLLVGPLLPGQTYELRAYVPSNAGHAYSDVATFSTAAVLPVVDSPVAGTITATSAVLGATVVSEGGTITERGIVFGPTATHPVPSLTNGAVKINKTGALGAFNVTPGTLTPGTSYSFCGFATNAAGTAYTSVVTFTTTAPMPLTLVVGNATRTYGAADPVFTGTFTGLQPGHNITATFGTNALATSDVGTYAIAASVEDPDGVRDLYDLTITPGVLTITPAQVTITVPQVSVVTQTTATSVPVTAMLTGNGVPVPSGSVSFTSAVGNNAATPGTLSAGSATVSYPVSAGRPAGTYNVTVAFPGSTNFAARTTTVPGAIRVIDTPNVASLQMPIIPGTTTTGTPGTVRIVARTAGGATATTYTGTVTITCTDAHAQLPAAYTFTAADRGVKDFPITFRRAGTHTITAQDAANVLTVSRTNAVNPRPHYGPQLVAWGDGGSYGSLGVPPQTFLREPEPVKGNFDVLSMAAAEGHSLAVRPNGTVWAWGSNFFGQLGINAQNMGSAEPVAVAGVGSATILSGCAAVAAGGNFSVALTTGGTVLTWGENYSGQLGDGTTTPRLRPVAVRGLTGVTAISAGRDFVLARKSNGEVYGWGSNMNHQLGFSSTERRLTPVLLPGLGNVTAISAGSSHGLALRSDGTVIAWGRGAILPGGAVLPTVVSGISSVKAVSAGENWSLLLKTDGTAWTWGSGPNGQLGQGAPAHSEVPLPVVTSTLFTDISAGRLTAYARTAAGELYSWGMQFGRGNAETPVLFDTGIVKISAGPTAWHYFATAGLLNTSAFDIETPADNNSGEPFNFTVTAIDADNNQVGFLGPVQFYSDDYFANLPPDYTFVALDKGRKTFSASFQSPGENLIGVRSTDPANLAFGESEPPPSSFGESEAPSPAFGAAGSSPPPPATPTTPTKTGPTGSTTASKTGFTDPRVRLSDESASTKSSNFRVRFECSIRIPTGKNVDTRGTFTLTLKTQLGVLIGPSVTGKLRPGDNDFFMDYMVNANTPPGTYDALVEFSGNKTYRPDTATSKLVLRANKGGTSKIGGSSGGSISSEGSLSGATGTFSEGSSPPPVLLNVGTYSLSPQTVTLSTTVTSELGIVNEGTMDFTVIDSLGDTIATASAAVLNDTATTPCDLPPGLPAGSYVVRLAYSGGETLEECEGEQLLTIDPATTSITGTSATANHSTFAQSLRFSAFVTSPAGAINEGTVTFTVKDSLGTTIGTPVTSSTIANGYAVADYTLPASLSPGAYTVHATCGGSTNLAASTDAGQSLVINGVAATVSINLPLITAGVSPEAQSITLNATLASPGGMVNDGTLTAQVFFNGSPVGEATTSALITDGTATLSYDIPADSPAGSYQILATYSGGSGFLSSQASGALVLSDISDARLALLDLAPFAITPGFSSDDYNYSLTLANHVTSLVLTPTPVQSGSTMSVNATPTPLGGSLIFDNLALGLNTIQTLVTAADGVSTRLYTLNITRQTGFQTYAAANSLDLDDPDQLARYAFGQPLGAATGALSLNDDTLIADGTPALLSEAGNHYAAFIRRKDYLTAGLTYTVQFSANLISWFNSTAVPTPVASDADTEAVVLPYPASVGGQPPQFFRVIVSQP